MRKMKVMAVAALSVAGVALTVTGASAVPQSAERPSGKTYVAEFSPLNNGQHGSGADSFTIPTASGNAVINLAGNEVTVTVNVEGVTPMTLHPQHIHAGTMCPTAADDVNNDSFVDVIEGVPKYGPILVPLDSDLNSFAPSLDFPIADSSGSYSYSEEAARSHLQAELKEALKLGDRHVVIHGINPTDPLPSSVQSLPGLPAWATLPVACGELSLQDGHGHGH